mmetsp:Transcript_417/g.553  ORF Transcript_417/g.553 Transcript_417/m.553 type:complete len:632 (-) Transcript_417:79-1974(-)
MANSERVMIKIQLSAIDDNLGLKMMKVDLSSNVGQVLTRYGERFNFTLDPQMVLVLERTQTKLCQDDVLSDHGVENREIFELVIEKAPPAPTLVGEACIRSWSVQEVCAWLRLIGIPDPSICKFHDNLVKGEDLLELTDAELKEDMGITRLGTRKKILRELKKVVDEELSPDLSSPPPTSSAPTRSATVVDRSHTAPPVALTRQSSTPVVKTSSAGGRISDLQSKLAGLPSPPSVGASSSSDANSLDVPAQTRSRAPSLVSAAAAVAAANKDAGAEFRLPTKSYAPGQQEPPAYLDEVRVAGTLMAEMRAAVQSSNERASTPNSSSSSSSSTSPNNAPHLRSSGRQHSFGSGKLGKLLSSRSTVSGLTATVPVKSKLIMNIDLVKKLLVGIKENGGIQLEGIFRISGNSNTVRIISSQMEDLTSLDLSGAEPHDISSAFKSYLRELPNPLVPYSVYPNMIKSVTAPTIIDKEQLKAALDSMPAENRSILRLILTFLRTVADQQAVNKMTPKNLAIVFGPTLLRSEDPMAGLREAANQTEVVQNLIENHQFYCGVETFDQLTNALDEVQQEYKASNPTFTPTITATPTPAPTVTSSSSSSSSSSSKRHTTKGFGLNRAWANTKKASKKKRKK